MKALTARQSDGHLVVMTLAFATTSDAMHACVCRCGVTC